MRNGEYVHKWLNADAIQGEMADQNALEHSIPLNVLVDLFGEVVHFLSSS